MSTAIATKDDTSFNFVARQSPRGNYLGDRLNMGSVGSIPASQVRKLVKQEYPDLKGKALRDKVNELVSKKASASNVLGRAYIDKLIEDGSFIDTIDRSKNGTVHTVKIKEKSGKPMSKVQKLEAQLAQALSLLEAQGIDINA